MVCHGEHTYLYSQVLMHILAQETKGGSNIRRLCQELQKSAQARSVHSPVDRVFIVQYFAKYRKMTYHSTGIRLMRVVQNDSGFWITSKIMVWGYLWSLRGIWLCCLTSREMDVTPITLALSGAAAYPRACQALSSMLSKNALNPADITIVSYVYIYRVNHLLFPAS